MRLPEVKILIADDSRPIHTFIAEIVSRWSMPARVVTADDGQQCMELLASGDIDLAFIDINMPEMTGMEALGAARYQGIKTFVTLMSAKTSAARLKLARELKVYEYLVKPFEAAAVEAILRTFQRVTQPTRALIVDDSTTVRRMIQRILANSLFRITAEEAGDGPTALRKWFGAGYDIVFLDCNMPGLNGIDTLEQLLSVKPDARVIMMSGERNEQRRLFALQRGAVDFLYKPFYPIDVDRTLHGVYDLEMPELAASRVDDIAWAASVA
jgi:DNA-binding response OmpR family regulator